MAIYWQLETTAVISKLDYGGNIQIWDFQSKKNIFNQSIHGEGLTSVVFSPDGRTLISGGKDGKLAVFQQV